MSPGKRPGFAPAGGASSALDGEHAVTAATDEDEIKNRRRSMCSPSYKRLKKSYFCVAALRTYGRSKKETRLTQQLLAEAGGNEPKTKATDIDEHSHLRLWLSKRCEAAT
jgi:hypothetical protein